MEPGQGATGSAGPDARDPDQPGGPQGSEPTRADEQFVQLARPHMVAVLQLAAALIGFADAEDAAQEALLRGLRAWPTVRDPAALRGWLLRITYNVCLDWRRGHFGTARRLTQPLTQTGMSQLPTQHEGPGTSEHTARMDLRAAINGLGADLRQIVMLRYYVGLDATEIGTLLGLPPATVRSHLRRARDHLRDQLRDHLRERLSPPPEPPAGRDEKGGR